MFDPLDALAAEAAMERREADPLQWFRWPSDRHRMIPRAFAKGLETAVRAPNQGAKTTSGAYIVTGVARGETELDGEPIPYVGTPNTGALLVHSYKLASESSIKAVMEAVGGWPHHLEMGSQGTVLAVRIRPKDSTAKDWRRWSRLLVLSEDGPQPEGLRLDYVWADEPPKWPYWQTLRGRGRANRQLFMLITFTPIDRQRWQPIRKEFAGCEFPGHEGKCEIRLALKDNRFLSKAHRDALFLKWKDDPYFKAKFNGDYHDAGGSCPFKAEGLDEWERCARPGAPFADDPGDDHGVGTEVWYEPEPDEDYFVVCDPSSGLKDIEGENDPCAAIVVSRIRPRLCARYLGYRMASELGELAVRLARRYNNAMVVHESNSGFGEAFLHGVRDYGNLYVRHHTDKASGIITSRIGWHTAANNRGTIIGALQKAVKEAALGEGLIVHSAQAVLKLRNVILNPQNKIVAAKGEHDEDMIVLGLACHLLETLPIYTTRKVPTLGQEFEAAVGAKRAPRDDDPFAL